MDSTIFVELVTPEKLFFSDNAASVIVPGAEGDIGVLPAHAPLISTLRPGVVAIEGRSGTSHMVVTEGFVEVTPERCTILAESATTLENLSIPGVEHDIDTLKAEMEKEYREDALKEKEKQLQQLITILDVLKTQGK